MDEAHKNNGGAHRKPGPDADDILIMLGQLSLVDTKHFTELEQKFMYELFKTVKRGDTVYMNERKIILDLHRREVV